MGKEVLTFGYNEIEKQKFHCYKNPIYLEDVDDDKTLISGHQIGFLLMRKFMNTLLVTRMFICLSECMCEKL